MQSRVGGNEKREPRMDRRRFGRWTARLGAALALGGGAALLAPRVRAEDAKSSSRPAGLLERSEFAYISPLRSDGRESACHAELWYAWLDDHVVVIVSRDGWKARAVAAGLDRARVWIGSHGRWKSWYGGKNEAFRKGSVFDARVERVEDDALLERLLARYEAKYPAEIADWRDDMRSGYADGSRVLLRYALTPPPDAT